MGFRSYIDFGPNGRVVLGQIVAPKETTIFDLFASNVNHNYNSRTKSLRVNYRKDLLPTEPRWYFDTSVDLTFAESFYIHSSLTTNIWNKDGSRSDVIAVIPIMGDSTTIPIEYTPPGDGGRVYQVRETVTGATSFGIRITDQFDVPIPFIDDYELTIALFFQPVVNDSQTF